MIYAIILGAIIILLFCPGIRFVVILGILFYLFKYGGITWIVDGIKLFLSWWKAFYKHSSFGKFVTWMFVVFSAILVVYILLGICLIIIFN